MRTVFLLILTASTVLGQTKQSGGAVETVVTNDAYLFERPSSTSDWTTRIPRGAKITVLDGAKAPFMKVRYKNVTGFVHEDYLDISNQRVKTHIAEMRQRADEEVRRAKEQADEEKEAKKAEEARRLEALLTAKTLSPEQLHDLCYGYRSLVVSCGLWKVGKTVDPMTDKQESYLAWIGGDEGTVLFSLPGPQIVFTTEDLLTITDSKATVKLRIDKGAIRTLKAHVFKSQVTILASAAVRSKMVSEILSADQVVMRVPDYRNAEHTVLLRFKPKNPREKVQIESKLKRKAAVQLWRGSQNLFESVLR